MTLFKLFTCFLIILVTVPAILANEGGGLTNDKCQNTSECQGDRECKPKNTETIKTCEGRDDCVCKPPSPKKCSKSSECEEGEVCSESKKVSDQSPECRSSAFVQGDEGYEVVGGSAVGPSPESDVCIGAHLLGDFAPSELAYSTHRLANVLCDELNNCATPGHIVVYDGVAMMMKGYCELATCEKRVLRVNSPKYQRQLRVKSMHSRLHFTAFAARYGTKLEEMMLTTAVSLRL